MLLTPDREQEYLTFIENCPKSHFAQTPMWAKIKDNWKNEVVISLDEEGRINGALSILIRPVPFFRCTLMYAPRGPVCDIHNEKILQALADGAKEAARKYNAYELKMDPDVPVSDTIFPSILKKCGFRLQDTGKNFDGIQPRFVFRLDIKGKTKDDLFAAFQSKTRYNIRLAVRKGVTTSIGSRSDLKRFHEIMVETGQRDGFIIRTLEYFEKMYDVMAPTDNLRLYLAHYEGQIISGTIAIRYGNKVWYLYGASSNQFRNVMPNYLLQWEMIQWAVDAHCDIYDFRGVSGDISEDNPLYGLYRFKKGFSGDFTEFLGDADLVFRPFTKFVVEKGEKLYRKLRRKVMLHKK